MGFALFSPGLSAGSEGDTEVKGTCCGTKTKTTVMASDLLAVNGALHYYHLKVIII